MYISIDLENSADYAEKINVYNNGSIVVYRAADNRYLEIAKVWKSMLVGAHEMPAYGVSLNNETLQALKSGVWAEFVFDKMYEHNGMPFEKLLINVEKDFYGFNIIRFNSETGYDGRCFYYDLFGGNMNDLYDILLNI